MKHAAILFGFVLVFVLLARDSVFAGPYIYDEADYMYAASKGVIANAFDAHTLPITRFIRLGFELGRDRSRRTQLSEAVRGNDDEVFYRHWHGPLLYYYLEPLEALRVPEQVTRASMLVFPLLTLVAVYFGMLWILPPDRAFAGAVLTTALIGWNFAAIKSSEVAPHQAYAFAAVVFLLILTKAIATGERKYWYLSIAAAGIAFAVLEVAFVLLLALPAVLWVERRTLRPDWGFGLRSAGVFIATVLAAWPGAVLKLSFLKAYFFLAYLSVFRRAAWGETTLAQTWWTRLTDTPLDWLLLAGCVAAFVVVRNLPDRRMAWPSLLYGVLMMLLVGRVATLSPRYSLPFLPAFDLFCGIVLTDLVCVLGQGQRRFVVAALVGAIGFTTWMEMRAHPLSPEPRPPALMSAIRERGLTSGSLLVPQLDLPVLHYYFPGMQLRGYRDATPSPEEVGAARFDAIVYPGLPLRMKRW